jgi:hypothetical protein
MSAARFAAAYAALHASHQVGDFCVQTDRDAVTKALPGFDGHAACARHVASYTATQAIALTAANLLAGAELRPGRILAGLAVSAISHYVIDRRTLLKRAAYATGKGALYQIGAPRPGHDDNPCLGTGAYALDQATHTAFLFIAALVIAGGER